MKFFTNKKKLKEWSPNDLDRSGLKFFFTKIKWKIKFFFEYIRYDIPYGIKQIFDWFLIIWNDRHWDYMYIYYILRFKIKKTSFNIKRYSYSINKDIDIEDCELAIKLLDKIINVEYETEYMDYFKLKTKFIPNQDNKTYLFNSEIISENFDEYFAKHPKIYSQALIKVKQLESYNDILYNKKRIALIMSQLRQEKLERIFFKFLEYKIKNWWV